MSTRQNNNRNDPPMVVLRELCERRISSCWKIHYYAEKACRRGDLSKRDFRFVKNKLGRAMHQFERIIEMTDKQHVCETCARSKGIVGDDECDCTVIDRMTENDIILCNEKHCPYWVRKDEDVAEEGKEE